MLDQFSAIYPEPRCAGIRLSKVTQMSPQQHTTASPGGPKRVPRPDYNPSGGSTTGPPFSLMCVEHFQWERPRRHFNQTPSDKRRRLYYELSPDVWSPQFTSESTNPAVETHFGHMYWRCRPFGHCPKLVTKVEGWRINWLENWKPAFWHSALLPPSRLRPTLPRERHDAFKQGDIINADLRYNCSFSYVL